MKATPALLALWCLVPLAHAVPKYWEGVEDVKRYHFVASKGEWRDAKNWEKKALPAGYARAYIHGGCACTLASPCTVSDCVIIGERAKKAGELYIERGARAVLGSMHIPHYTQTASVGAVYMRDGELSFGNDNERAGALTVGAGGTVSGTGTFEISGGKIAGGIIVGSAYPNTHVGTLSVVGSKPAICANPANARGNFVLNKSGTLKFILDENGVAALDYRGKRAAFLGGSKVIVDGAAYKGGAKRIALLFADAISETPAVEIVNFDERYETAVFPEKKGKTESLVLKISPAKK